MKEQETVCSLHTAPPSVTSENATIEKAELSEPGVSITNVPPNPTKEQECNFVMGKCLIHKLKGTSWGWSCAKLSSAFSYAKHYAHKLGLELSCCCAELMKSIILK